MLPVLSQPGNFEVQSMIIISMNSYSDFKLSHSDSQSIVIIYIVANFVQFCTVLLTVYA